jgi:hypothetical protein
VELGFAGLLNKGIFAPIEMECLSFVTGLGLEVGGVKEAMWKKLLGGRDRLIR